MGLARHGMAAVLLALLAAGLGGCMFASPAPESRRLSILRDSPPALETLNFDLKRTELEAALHRENLVNKVRLVEVFKTAAAGATQGLPEYRLFEVHPDSVYYLLGLRNADVLVGANDRIIVDPSLFPEFVRRLPNEREAELEVRRGGKPLLLKYRILSPAPGPNVPG